MALLDMVQTGAVSSNGRPLPGKVNINTAPLAVLRSLGMLSPSLAWDPFNVPENWIWRMGAEAAGLTHRPWAEVVRDTLAWTGTGPEGAVGRGVGLSPDREQELLAAWSARP